MDVRNVTKRTSLSLAKKIKILFPVRILDTYVLIESNFLEHFLQFPEFTFTAHSVVFVVEHFLESIAGQYPDRREVRCMAKVPRK